MNKIYAIASDHAGFDLKEQIKASLLDIKWLDLGTTSYESVDYPDYAVRLAKSIEAGESESGILICGTGIGMSIAANRFSFIRAAHCTSATEARLTRMHNDANVLALGARIIGFEIALDCVKAFIETDFEGGRHLRRIEKLLIQEN